MQKVVGYYYSDDDSSQIDTNNLLNSVNSELNIETELATHLDSRLTKYSTTPDRLPCYMIFKNNVCKSIIHAKLSERDLINWVVNKVG